MVDSVEEGSCNDDVNWSNIFPGQPTSPLHHVSFLCGYRGEWTQQLTCIPTRGFKQKYSYCILLHFSNDFAHYIKQQLRMLRCKDKHGTQSHARLTAASNIYALRNEGWKERKTRKRRTFKFHVREECVSLFLRRKVKRNECSEATNTRDLRKRALWSEERKDTHNREYERRKNGRYGDILEAI